jgi:heterodisulfide reductase subunit C/nitrate reductase gamma subunit
MILKISLYISLSLFGIGLLYRISSWYRLKIGPRAHDMSTFTRIASSFKGTIAAVLSPKILTLLKTLFLEVILQKKIMREDLVRWIMHMLIYSGFMLLLLMHALQAVITSKLFPDYNSTLNPYMFLRDLFGMMVIAGLIIAVYRRFIAKVPRLATGAMDVYLIAAVGVIILTGIFLEGAKITSYARYREMVTDYGAAENAAESKALESYWVEHFHVVSPDKSLAFDGATLKLGKEVSGRTCVSCHSDPRWAFSGFTVAAAIRPVASGMDAAGVPHLLFYLHYFACLFALGYLPFSKSFHIIATPISLLANSVMREGASHPANVATRQVMELDACTHCGTCSLRCSALAAFGISGNSAILPSEKLQSIRALARGKRMSDCQLALLREGVYLCTNCDRCTVACPSGINLRELWFQVREELIQRGDPMPIVLSPLSHFRGLKQGTLGAEYTRPLDEARVRLTSGIGRIKKGGAVPVSIIDKEFASALALPEDSGTYSYCFKCSTCTTSCPVVTNYDNPMETLGLLPHQIIHSVALGLKDMAVGSRMLWDCLTCYKCEENCPQGVRIVEVLYRLKNLAIITNRRSFQCSDTSGDKREEIKKYTIQV